MSVRTSYSCDFCKAEVDDSHVFCSDYVKDAGGFSGDYKIKRLPAEEPDEGPHICDGCIGRARVLMEEEDKARVKEIFSAPLESGPPDERMYPSEDNPA